MIKEVPGVLFGGFTVWGSKLRFLDFKILIFNALFYKEKNTKLYLDMTTEEQHFYSDPSF